MSIKTLPGIFLFLLCFSAWAAEDCRKLLRSELSPDQKFQAYFSDLLDETVLGTEELRAYIKTLEEGRIENPVTDRVALLKWEAQIHRDSLQRYVDGGELTLEGQLAWAKKKLEEREYSRERREVTRENTRKLTLEAILPNAKMIPIEGGKFIMGSPEGEIGRGKDEGQVEVELSPFEIMDTPVTQRMWYEVMGENPSGFQEAQHCKNHTVINGVSLCPENPVEQVGWNDVQTFIKKLNQKLGLNGNKGYRLPTEAQWEYAARAGTTTAYSFGDDPGDLEKYAVFSDNQTRPVKSKQPNPWGLYDMHGNVWEWTQDYYGKELPGGIDPLQNHSPPNRIVRGGSWGNGSARNLRSAGRPDGNSDGRDGNVGFRLMRTL